MKISFLTFILGFFIFLSLNRHSKSGIQNYHSEIWADKAGYYIYLPAFFIYNFQVDGLPAEIDKKTGNGFIVRDGKIITKYTYGVALLQAPFFIICHGLSKLCNLQDDGFSLIYHKSINIAAVIYSFFSFIFLFNFLIRYLKKKVVIITLACLYIGTNIFYYSVFETGMSHIYSLFLFASYLYLGPIANEQKKPIYVFLFGLIIGLIIIVRPINILFLPVYFIFNTFSITDIKNNLKRYILIFITVFIVLMPQLLYWKYASGSYFQYSYGEERFSNLLHPEVLKLLFSTNNGLFIYCPLLIFFLTGLFILYKHVPRFSICIAVHFIFISFVFSSWHDWTYGCSYGCRPFVEYISIFALPFGFFIEKFILKNSLKPLWLTLIIVFIVYNQKLIFSYDGCWAAGIWDWSELLKLIISETK